MASSKPPGGSKSRADTELERREMFRRKRSALSRQSSDAKRHYDSEKLAEIETKRQLLVKMEKVINQSPKSVFISYTGNGARYYQKAREVFEASDFVVRTGFDREVQKGKVIAVEIMSQIRESSIFLAIWTQDFDSQSRRGTDGTGAVVPSVTGGTPGVWMPFELGVAAAMGKPLKILFQRGMHHLYIEKPLGASPHIPFDDANFDDSLLDARDALIKWYREVVTNTGEEPEWPW
tara:strand:+ start:2247 stop:2951 length:705 start_codon:yes stop_codon:yes gene_type:complete